MILDAGICTVFRRVDVSDPGGMQKYGFEMTAKSWYGMLSYETTPVNPTGDREDTETAARIRIHQNRMINNHCIVVLEDAAALEETAKRYEVTRAYHGADDESGEMITDLTLTEVEK